MITMSERIMRALSDEPTTRTATIDLLSFDDLIAGQSEIVIDDQLYGVLGYECLENHQATAILVALND